MKSMRFVAQQANVAPSTMVRLAQALSFDGYDTLREQLQFDLQQIGFSARLKRKSLHRTVVLLNFSIPCSCHTQTMLIRRQQS